MSKYDRMDSIFEGFENRIAIGDLEDKVKEAIIVDLCSWMKLGGISQESLLKIQKLLDAELTTVYFDIDTLEVETDGDSMEILAKELEITPEELAKSISELLSKMPAKNIGKYESTNETDDKSFTSWLSDKAKGAEPTRVDWTKVGEEFVKTPEDKAKIEKEMKKLKWETVTGQSVGFSQGAGIKGVIKEFKLPKVDMFAIGGGFGLSGEPSASYGFYGIQANYKDERVRIHVLDSGIDITPIAIEIFKK